MDLTRDESSVILLSVNGKPCSVELENNNMVESDSFTTFEYDIPEDQEKKVKRRTRTPLVIAWVCVGCAVVFAVAAVILLIRYTAFKGDTGSQNQTSSSSTALTQSISSISPTPSTVSLNISTAYSSITPSTPSVLPSFSPTSASTTSFTSSVSLPSVSSISQTVSSVSSTIINTPLDTSTSSMSTKLLTMTATVISTSSFVKPTKTLNIPSTVLSTMTVQSTSSFATASATATVVVTTPLPACESGQFQCSDGSCIDETRVCNGKPECPSGEDEAQNCKCSDVQFTCGSGQCIQDSFRCDMTPHCYDMSDEVNCTNCSGYQCASGLCLWTNTVRCNGKVDCLDLSDELNCEKRRGYDTCKNGMQVRYDQWCNGVDDCYDNSDETDCQVEDDMDCFPKKPCGDGSWTCVTHEWWCDGVRDCPKGGDEAKCGTCRTDQFQCPDYKCVAKTQVCDGIKQCDLGTDEVDCLQLNSADDSSSGVVMMKSQSHDQQLPVCSDVWSSDVADEICQHLGQGSSAGHRFVTLASAGVTGTEAFMSLENTGTSLLQNQTVLSRFIPMSTCTSQKVVSLTCLPKVCGERKIDIMTPFIYGGSMSPRGKWPWMVSLSLLGRDVCGGVLVDNRWVLGAAHCVVTGTADYTLTPHFYEATIGTTSRQRKPNDKAQRIRIDKIVTHPSMLRLVTGLTDWDMALFHLSRPVEYGDYIQPICPPGQGQQLPTSSRCYLAGWGFINSQEMAVNELREVKMRLWGDQDCRGSFVAGETNINTNSTLCAGYQSGLISGCQGDSGGPLMCADTRGQWTVAGVMSSGTDGCNGQSHKANRFAKVSSAADWMHSVIQTR